MFFLPPGLNILQTDCDSSSSDESESEGHSSKFVESNIHDNSIPRADPANLAVSPNRPCSPLPTLSFALQSQNLHSSVSPHGIDGITVPCNVEGIEVADLGYGLSNGEVNLDLPTAPSDSLPNLSTSFSSAQTNPVRSFSNIANSFQTDIPVCPVSPLPNQKSVSLTSTPTNVHAILIPDASAREPSPIFAISTNSLPPAPDLKYLRSKAERSHAAGDWLKYLEFASPPGSLPEQRYKDYRLAFLVMFNEIYPMFISIIMLIFYPCY